MKDAYDTRFGIKGTWDIVWCSKCLLTQLGSSPSLDKIEVLYQDYYNFGGSKDRIYTRARSAFYQSFICHMWTCFDGDISFHQMKGSGRLLDIGCNEGRGLMIYRNNGFEVEGLELNEKAAAEGMKAGFRVYTEPVEQSEWEENLSRRLRGVNIVEMIC